MDYRTSHLGEAKAHSYHSGFGENPYRRMVWEMEKVALDRILAQHFPHGVPAYLDFACGTGRVASHILSHAQVSLGIDISADMIEIAQAEVPGCEFVIADLTTHDVLEDRQFDLVTAFRFFPNAQATLRRAGMAAIVSHMKPGGLLVFNNHKTRSSLIYRLGHFIRGKRQHSMSTAEVEELVQAYGLEIIGHHHIGVLPVTDRRHPPIAALRKVEDALSALPPLRSLAHNNLFVARRPL